MWFTLLCASFQGLSPQIRIHSVRDLSLLASISWDTEAGFAGLAFSGDGTQLAAIEQETCSHLIVWDWQEVKILSCLGSCSLPGWLDLMLPYNLSASLAMVDSGSSDWHKH